MSSELNDDSPVTLDIVFEALSLPPDCRVNFRIAKAKLLGNNMFSAADKKLLREGLEAVTWVGLLKPDRGGVPAYTDDARNYKEIAVIIADLTPRAKTSNLHLLIHRSIAYPVVLLSSQSGTVTISVAHKRSSLAQEDAWVLDDVVDELELSNQALAKEVLKSLPLERQARSHMFALYQSWAGVITAGRAARFTGYLCKEDEPEYNRPRKEALAKLESLQRDVDSLRKTASSQRQLKLQVEINLKVKQLESEITGLKQSL